MAPNPELGSIALLVLVVGSGCRAAAVSDLGTPAWYVDDGVHNGLLFRAEDAPFRPYQTDPSPDRRTVRFVEYGYAERSWVLGHGRTPFHLWAITRGTGEGVVVVRVFGTLEDAIEGRSVQQVTLDGARVERLGQFLEGWVSPEKERWIIVEQPVTYVLSSSRPYSTLKNNCRHFTAEALEAMQLDVQDLVTGAASSAR